MARNMPSKRSQRMNSIASNDMILEYFLLCFPLFLHTFCRLRHFLIEMIKFDLRNFLGFIDDAFDLQVLQISKLPVIMHVQVNILTLINTSREHSEVVESV
jgi:hypothetical protein